MRIDAGEHQDFLAVLGALTIEQSTEDEWLTRPLDAVYPVVVVDAVPVKIRGAFGSSVQAVIGLDCEGIRSVLGLWREETLSAVLADLRSRGVVDVCVLQCRSADDVAGALWPGTVVQPWAVQLIRSSLRYARTRDRAALRSSMRAVFTAPSLDSAQAAVEGLAERWPQYPAVVALWRSHWGSLEPMLALPLDVRRPLYQTSLVESVHQHLRDAARSRDAFASDRDALTALYLALREVPELTNARPVADWKRILQAYTTHFDGRLPLP